MNTDGTEQGQIEPGMRLVTEDEYLQLRFGRRHRVERKLTYRGVELMDTGQGFDGSLLDCIDEVYQQGWGRQLMAIGFFKGCIAMSWHSHVPKQFQEGEDLRTSINRDAGGHITHSCVEHRPSKVGYWGAAGWDHQFDLD